MVCHHIVTWGRDNERQVAKAAPGVCGVHSSRNGTDDKRNPLALFILKTKTIRPHTEKEQSSRVLRALQPTIWKMDISLQAGDGRAGRKHRALAAPPNASSQLFFCCMFYLQDLGLKLDYLLKAREPKPPELFPEAAERPGLLPASPGPLGPGGTWTSWPGTSPLLASSPLK